MSRRRPHCPVCVSSKVVPIRYGMATEEAWEESKKGKFVLGGCCISDESAKWYCQACGHEFGKEMPSLEILLNPEPDGIKPYKLEFYIGGFTGPNHSVKFENGVLKYNLFEAHPDYPQKQIEVAPSTRRWINFRRKLDTINVWKWKNQYVDPDVCDGTQWEFEVDYGVKKIQSEGNNSYPGYESIIVIDEGRDDQASREFDVLLHALSLLLGGIKIN